MNRSTIRIPALALALVATLLGTAPARAQVPGENVNMVTGTQWPGGDPFLQRQNEPSLAVSSANPQHLLAGANDYRSVDVPYPFGPNDPMKMPGDAWLGVFKSLNGGQTWQSVLMPGFPQDSSPLASQGASSPLRNCVKGSTLPADRCTSAADPVVRAGTDGMLYYSGIAFKRGTSWGKVFLSRFIDLNNKENGDATRTDPADPTKATPTDPIRFVDQIVVASSDGQVFLDKPWIAVDKPRLLAQTCKITTSNPDGTTTTRAFPGGAIYMSWIKFAPGEVTSDVMFSSSRDCGKTWTSPLKLNDATSSLNQAPTIAIDPFTGFVYVAWRRMSYPATNPTQKDAILVARSFRGFLFTKPRLVAEFRPFEQGSSGSRFRTHAFPSIAVSVDKTGLNGWVHIAWPQRMGPHGDSRVVISTAPVLPPPLNGLEAGDPCNGWSVPMPVDDHGILVPFGKGAAGGFRTFTRGHQFMPSLTFSQGKLVVLYYDSRLTHTAQVHEPNDPFAADAFGSFYRSERVPITPWNPADRTGSPEDPSRIFKPVDDEIDDQDMRNVRHTVEVRVGTSPPGKDPVFSSVQVSRYRFGERGDEPPYFSVPQFAGTDSETFTVTDRAGGLPVTDDRSFLRLQQFDVNAPNLPMFKNGTVPFLGDYIDVQGPAFVRKSFGWSFATEPVAAPVFHAVWATNQDVRAPADGDWSHYTPMKLPGRTGTVFDGGAAATPAYCTPGVPSNEGTRNQNVYTARITEGLLVSSPQNAKPLSASQTRSFVVVAHNDTAYPKAFRFTFTGITPASCSNGVGQAAPTSCASFGPDASIPAVDVEVLPHSSVTRSLFVRSGNASQTLVVNVNEVVRPDPTATTPQCSLALLGCAYVPNGLSGFVTLNPPGASPTLVAPDGSTTGAGTSETIAFANVSTANVSTANVSTANVSTANVSTANISTANVSTANVCTANVSTANVSTANVSTANVSTAPVSDLNYEVTNTSNTTTSYSVQFVCADPAGCPADVPLHLMVHKFYVVPASVGCQLVAEPRPVLVANGGYVQDALVQPGSLVDPRTRDGAASNATVSLAPGEKAQITLRGRVTVGEMAAIGTRVAPAVVPHSTPIGGSVGGTQTYASSTTVGLPASPSQTTLTVSGSAYTATVTAAAPATGIPTGKVTFIAGGGTVVGVGPLDGTGRITLTASIPVGTPVVAYYGGDSRFKASSGSYAQRLTTQLDLSSDANNPSVPGAGIVLNFLLRAPRGTPAPIGAVQVYDGEIRLGGPATFICAPVPGGQECSGWVTATPARGNHSFWAEYAGDAGYLPSTSAPLSWAVTAATVTVSGPASLLIGGSATFTASVVNAASQSVTWSVSPSTTATIDPSGLLHVSAPDTYTVVARSVADPAATGQATVSVAAPTLQLTTTASTPVTTVTGQAVPFSATVTGFQSPSVTWSVLPAGTGASVTPSTDTLSATFTSTTTGQFTVTATAGSVAASVLVTVNAAVVASPFGINATVNDRFVNVAVWQDGQAYNDATVTVTGPGGPITLGRVGNGVYQNVSFVLPPAGSTVTLRVEGAGLVATGNATVAALPTVTSPQRDSVVLASDPVVVSWTLPTGATNPDGFTFDGWCGNGQCVAGSWATVPGADRSLSFPGGFFPAGKTVQMGLYAFNQRPLAGDALPASILTVNTRAPGDGTWWTFLPTTSAIGSMVTGRMGHQVVSLGGFVYSIGGVDAAGNYLASVERFDPFTQTSVLVSPMLSPRHGAGAAVANGRIYVFGGAPAPGSYTDTVEEYDPGTNVWVAKARMPAARFLLRGAYAASAGKVLAVGGWSSAPAANGRVDAYDPASDTWTSLGVLPTSRAAFALAESGGKAYAIGGYTTDAASANVASVDVVDAATGALSTLPGPAQAVGYATTAVTLPDGAIAVVGGSTLANLVETFVPSGAGAWALLDAGWRDYYRFDRAYVGAAIPDPADPGAKIYVTGGTESSTGAISNRITLMPVPHTVVVSPASAFVFAGGTRTFTALVAGISSPTVEWSVLEAGGGSITPAGVYTAPATPGTYTVQGTTTAPTGELAVGRATVKVVQAPTPASISAGGDSSFDVRGDGSAWAWGTNNGGELGTGGGIGLPYPVPARVQAIPAGVLTVDAAAWYGMAIDRLGSLWAWGWGPAIGQAADNNPTPIEYGRLGSASQTVVAISAGYHGGLALRSDGLVFGFGQDAFGQLGAPAGHSGLRQVAGLSGVLAVAAGEQHTLALDSSGTVWSLGSNAQGQLGDGTTTSRTTPAPVPGLARIVAIAAGSWHSVALRDDGRVYTWGLSNVGQLGDGSTGSSPVPVEVPGLAGVTAIATGNNHTLAILSDGTVRTWGYNQFGQLGNGSTANAVTPVAVLAPSGPGYLGGVVEVSGGEWHSMARLADGSIYLWGRNDGGQLGSAPGPGSGVPARYQPVTVVVDPPSVELGAGDSMGFFAIVGGTGNSAVAWSVSEAGGGTVDPAGNYVAPATPGTYHVIATSLSADDPTASGSATVTVTLPVVSLTPATAQVVAGGQVAFSASVSGSSIGSVSWSATGGTISPAGLYTAPATAGTYTVRATSVASSLAFATATVTVIVPVTTRTRLNLLQVTPPPPQTTGNGTFTFTATVIPASGAAMPTGTLTFTVDGAAQAPVALQAGTATLAVSIPTFTSATASYSGDGLFLPSTSTPFTVTTSYLPDSVDAVCSDGSQFIPCPSPGQPAFGQDGSVLVNVPTFSVSASGLTATDSVTGLAWTRLDTSGTVRNYPESAAYCASLAASGYDGDTGWRLPTVREALTIVNTGRNGGAVGPSTFFPYIQNGGVWTTDAYAPAPALNWTIALNYPILIPVNRAGNPPGPTNGNWPGTACVSSTATAGGGIPTTGGAFLVNVSGKPGTRLDVSTRLYWRASTASEGTKTTFTWLEALAHCDGLNAGTGTDGLTSWRLPSLKELSTLVDVGGANPAIDRSIFPDTVPGLYWSSSPFGNFANHAYPVNFANGAGSINQADVLMTATHSVRCVAGGQKTQILIVGG